MGRAQNYQVIDDALADDERPYSLLPQVFAAGRWNDLPLGLGATFDFEATNFYRDLGRQGIRVDTQPALSWRTGRRGAYVEGNAAWRYTTYSLDEMAPGADESLSRSLPVMSLDTGFALERMTGSKQQRLQTLEPRLQYVYIPYRNQDAIPIFDTDTPTLNMVQLFRTNRYVGADRVGDANLVSVGVTSRLLDAGGGRQFLSATLGQAYYFEDPRVTLPDEAPTNRNSSDVVAELELDAFKQWNARAAYVWDPDANQTQRAEAALQYRLAGDSVAERRLPVPARPARTVRRLGGLADREELARLRPMGLLARGGQDARPVRGLRVLVVLLVDSRDHATIRQQPHRRLGHVRRAAAGTQGIVECRSGQPSFPARRDSWILPGLVRARFVRCH